jgi:hypothetical protein
VRFGPLRGRIPSAGPRPARDGSLLGLASDCLGRVVPSGQPSTDSNRACHAEAGESSGASTAPPGGGGLVSRRVTAYAGGAGALGSRGLPAPGQRPRGLETMGPSRWEAPPGGASSAQGARVAGLALGCTAARGTRGYPHSALQTVLEPGGHRAEGGRLPGFTEEASDGLSCQASESPGPLPHIPTDLC